PQPLRASGETLAAASRQDHGGGAPRVGGSSRQHGQPADHRAVAPPDGSGAAALRQGSVAAGLRREECDLSFVRDAASSLAPCSWAQCFWASPAPPCCGNPPPVSSPSWARFPSTLWFG